MRLWQKHVVQVYAEKKHSQPRTYCLAVRWAFLNAGIRICLYLLLCWFLCVCYCAGILLQETWQFAYVTGAIWFLWKCYLWGLGLWFFFWALLGLFALPGTQNWTLKGIATCRPSVQVLFNPSFCTFFLSKGLIGIMLFMHRNSQAAQNTVHALF